MSSGRFALEGQISKELLTNQLRIIWHDNPRELAWFFAKNIELGSIRVIELPSAPMGRPFVRLRDLPSMCDVEWPLDTSDFREGGE